MGKIHAHEFITPFSPFWWECILIVGLIIFVIVRIPLHWKNLKRRNYDLFIACILILNNIGITILLVTGVCNKIYRRIFVMLPISYALFYLSITSNGWRNLFIIGALRVVFNPC